MAIAIVLLLTTIFVPRKNAVVTVADTSAAIPQKSIAVLPLANDSGDKDQQYFSDGLSEDFINAPSQFDGLKVIGRNSAFQFRNTKDDAKTIGAKLGVAHLLEGSVRREPDAMFEWLQRAWMQRDPGFNLFNDPFVLAYQHDPRFAALCKQAGLPLPGEAPSASAGTSSRDSPPATTDAAASKP